MKKLIIFISICLILLAFISPYITKVYAVESPNEFSATNTEAESNLLKLKENQAKSLEEYQQKYGSDTYGFTAYVLHIVQIYSIPFCFLGIVISIIYKVVIGERHLENAEKGLGMIVAIVTITIICQILPLIFAIVVKVGRE